jgi:transcriptional regulator with XRE-family HTH domain
MVKTAIDQCEIHFGQRVKELRKLRKMSQEELGFQSDLHRNYISDIECGRRNISLRAIYKLARGLNVSVNALFVE